MSGVRRLVLILRLSSTSPSLHPCGACSRLAPAHSCTDQEEEVQSEHSDSQGNDRGFWGTRGQCWGVEASTSRAPDDRGAAQFEGHTRRNPADVRERIWDVGARGVWSLKDASPANRKGGADRCVPCCRGGRGRTTASKRTDAQPQSSDLRPDVSRPSDAGGLPSHIGILSRCATKSNHPHCPRRSSDILIGSHHRSGALKTHSGVHKPFSHPPCPT